MNEKVYMEPKSCFESCPLISTTLSNRSVANNTKVQKNMVLEAPTSQLLEAKCELSHFL